MQDCGRARSVSVRNYGDPIAADPPGGWGGWGLGKPDRTVWPTARLSVAGPPVPTYDDGFPKAHPSLPPGERAVRVRTETLPGAITRAEGTVGLVVAMPFVWQFGTHESGPRYRRTPRG